MNRKEDINHSNKKNRHQIDDSSRSPKIYLVEKLSLVTEKKIYRSTSSSDISPSTSTLS